MLAGVSEVISSEVYTGNNRPYTKELNEPRNSIVGLQVFQFPLIMLVVLCGSHLFVHQWELMIKTG